MSYILPNGSRIGVRTVSDLEYIGKCLREKIPITVTSVDFDGTETTHVLWHPDDPVMPLVDRGPKSDALRVPAVEWPERLTLWQKIRSYLSRR
jgi:hypothetical protein